MVTARRFEFTDEGSSKFWEIERDGASVTTRYGRIGASGKDTVKAEPSVEAASKLVDSLVREKVRKGYVEVSGAAAPATSAAPTPASSTASKKLAAVKGGAGAKVCAMGFVEPGMQLLYEIAGYGSADGALVAVARAGADLALEVTSAGAKRTLTFTAEALENANAFLMFSQGHVSAKHDEDETKPLRKNLPPFLLSRRGLRELNAGTTTWIGEEGGEAEIELVGARVIHGRVAGKTVELNVVEGRSDSFGFLVLNDDTWPIVLKTEWGDDCGVNLKAVGPGLAIGGDEDAETFSTYEEVPAGQRRSSKPEGSGKKTVKATPAAATSPDEPVARKAANEPKPKMEDPAPFYAIGDASKALWVTEVAFTFPSGSWPLTVRGGVVYSCDSKAVFRGQNGDVESVVTLDEGVKVVDVVDDTLILRKGTTLLTVSLAGGVPKELGQLRAEPREFAFDETHFYFRTNDYRFGDSIESLRRADGTSKVVVEKIPHFGNFAAAAGVLYWMDLRDRALYAVKAEGGTPTKLVAKTAGLRGRLRADSEAVYWISNDAIFRFDHVRGKKVEILSRGGSSEIALYGDYLYALGSHGDRGLLRMSRETLKPELLAVYAEDVDPKRTVQELVFDGDSVFTYRSAMVTGAGVSVVDSALLRHRSVG